MHKLHIEMHLLHKRISVNKQNCIPSKEIKLCYTTLKCDCAVIHNILSVINGIRNMAQCTGKYFERSAYKTMVLE